MKCFFFSALSHSTCHPGEMHFFILFYSVENKGKQMTRCCFARREHFLCQREVSVKIRKVSVLASGKHTFLSLNLKLAFRCSVLSPD